VLPGKESSAADFSPYPASEFRLNVPIMRMGFWHFWQQMGAGSSGACAGGIVGQGFGRDATF